MPISHTGFAAHGSSKTTIERLAEDYYRTVTGHDVFNRLSPEKQEAWKRLARKLHDREVFHDDVRLAIWDVRSQTESLQAKAHKTGDVELLQRCNGREQAIQEIENALTTKNAQDELPLLL